MKDIDPQVASFLAPLVGSPAPGVYTITFPARYWRSEAGDGSLVALLDQMNDRLADHESRERVDLRSLNPIEVRQLIERKLGGQWLSKDAEHQSPLEAKRAWEGKAWRSQALDLLLWIAYWVSFVVASGWLVHSIHVFFRRRYQLPARGLRHFLSPLLTQLIIGVVGVAVAFLMPFTFWPGTLLVPVVVVVLLAEGWASFRRRHVA